MRNVAVSKANILSSCSTQHAYHSSDSSDSESVLLEPVVIQPLLRQCTGETAWRLERDKDNPGASIPVAGLAYYISPPQSLRAYEGPCACSAVSALHLDLVCSFFENLD